MPSFFFFIFFFKLFFLYNLSSRFLFSRLLLKSNGGLLDTRTMSFNKEDSRSAAKDSSFGEFIRINVFFYIKIPEGYLAC